MGKQLELMYKSGETCKANFQDVKITYLANELIKYLPVENAFGYVAKYQSHPKHK